MVNITLDWGPLVQFFGEGIENLTFSIKENANTLGWTYGWPIHK